MVLVLSLLFPTCFVFVICFVVFFVVLWITPFITPIVMLQVLWEFNELAWITTISQRQTWVLVSWIWPILLSSIDISVFLIRNEWFFLSEFNGNVGSDLDSIHTWYFHWRRDETLGPWQTGGMGAFWRTSSCNILGSDGTVFFFE